MKNVGAYLLIFLVLSAKSIAEETKCFDSLAFRPDLNTQACKSIDEDPVNNPAYMACIQELTINTELQGIKNKVALGPLKNQTFSMLANRTKPSKEDTALIARWADLRAECSTKLSDAMKQRGTPIQLQNLVNKIRPEFEQFAAELFNGQISYGDFAKKRVASEDEFQSTLLKLTQELTNQKLLQKEKIEQEAASLKQEGSKRHQAQCDEIRKNAELICGQVNAAKANGNSPGFSVYQCSFLQGQLATCR